MSKNIPTASKKNASPAKIVVSSTAKTSTKNNHTMNSEQKSKENNDTATTTTVEKLEDIVVKQINFKKAIPKEMQKLQNLTKWPIIMDEVGNLKTFYRMNELCIDFNPPLTVQRVQVALQRVFFGLSFNPDGSIDDHRKYTIPNEANRLIGIVMEEKDIGECIEELRKACNQLHPDLFSTIFEKADVKESGRDNIDRLFVMTKTADEIRQCDYYQFGAQNRSEIPFICVWITHRGEIPSTYNNFFGPRFKVEYN